MWESGDINTGFQQGVENGVDNLHLPKITALEKAVGNFRERLQSFFSLLFQSTSPCNISIHVPTVVREEERTSPFQINYIDCGRGLLLRGGAHRTNYVSSRDIRRRLLVNLRSRWSLVDMINFIIAHLNSSVARSCISLSSGIRMFARESWTREVRTNHCFLHRAEG